MKAGSSAVRQFFDDSVPLDIAVARGDEWQMLVSQPAEALRVGSVLPGLSEGCHDRGQR